MSGNNKLKIFDLVQFSLMDQNLMKVKDDYEGAFKPQVNPGPTHMSGLGTMPTTPDGQPVAQQAKDGLLVRIAATHAGIVTRNNGFYLPDKMKRGAGTFTENYGKPVLLHHQEHADPIGRVVNASYQDTSGLVHDHFHLKNGLVVKDKKGNIKGTINDTLLRDFIEGKMPFGMQVETICTLLKDSILDEPSYDGLGHIQVLANITDKSAIEKLLDGRYLTGSVGATTDKAVCSVCKQDWTEDGKCDHKPGAVYDSTKCFIIAGSLTYDEYSFVNVPADRHSRVLELHYNGVKDSIKSANDFTSRIYEVRLGFPQYDSVTKEEGSMLIQDNVAPGTTTDGVQGKDAKFDPRAKEEGNGVVAGGADAGKGKVKKAPKKKKDSEEHEDDCDCDECEAKRAEKKAKKDAAAPIDPNGIDPRAKKGKKSPKKKKDSEEHESDCECDECEAKKANDAKAAGCDDCGKVDPKGIDPRANKKAKKKKKDQAELDEFLTRIIDNKNITAEDVDDLYDMMLDEIDDAIKDGELTVKLEDATLSSEKRGKLAKSTFCGPEKSFPVPDCAHVTAARRLIGKYKGTGDKSAILACVTRKAKALGCGNGETKKKDSTVTTPVTDTTNQGNILQNILGLIESDKFFSNEAKTLTETELQSLSTILKKMAGLVSQDSLITILSAEGLVLSSECEKALLDEVVKTEEVAGELREEVDALRKEYNNLFQDMEALQDALTSASVDVRKVKEAHVSTLMTLKDGKVDQDAISKLADEVLTAETVRLTKEVDMAKIVDKLGNGMSREPTGTVADPTVIKDDKAVNQKRQPTAKDLEKIQEQVYTLLFSRGQTVADQFIKQMQLEGKLPIDETK